ncbi:STAS domain-containing protein [soil metagenome]|jgi:anti-anti-sigma factor
MFIRVDPITGAVVLSGGLDVSTVAETRLRLHQEVDGGTGDLFVDLSEVLTVDATGLGLLLGLHRRAGRCGRRLVLRGVPAHLSRLLVMTRLHRVLVVEQPVSA